MGNIKTTYLKKIGNTLIEKYPDDFSQDFNENKKTVGEFLDSMSKKNKNQVAGYITHLVDKKKRLSTLKISYQMKDLKGKKQKNRKK